MLDFSILNNKSRKGGAFAVVLAVATLSLAYALYYYFLSPVSVVKSSLKGGMENVSVSPEISLTFDKNFEGVLRRVSVKSSPPARWNADFAGGKTVLIKPKEPLDNSTIYTIKIGGKRVNPYSIEFKTESVKFGAGDSYAENAFQTYAKAFPLLKYLPYKTEKYTIMQKRKDEYFVIVFDIYKGELGTIKKEVFAWFRAKGVDPKSVKIEFE